MSDQPTAVKAYFEVTNLCNFRCDFCPMGESTRQPQHMDWCLFRDGIGGIVPDGVTITAGCRVLGEPILYHRTYDALIYAKEKGLWSPCSRHSRLWRSAIDSGEPRWCIPIARGAWAAPAWRRWSSKVG